MQFKPVSDLIRRLTAQDNEVSEKQAFTVAVRVFRLDKMPLQTPAPEGTTEDCFRHRLPLSSGHRPVRTKKTVDDSLSGWIQPSEDFAQIEIERRPGVPRNRTESIHTGVTLKRLVWACFWSYRKTSRNSRVLSALLEAGRLEIVTAEFEER